MLVTRGTNRESEANLLPTSDGNTSLVRWAAQFSNDFGELPILGMVMSPSPVGRRYGKVRV